MKSPLTFIFFFLIVYSIYAQKPTNDDPYNKDPYSEKLLDSIHDHYISGEYKKSLVLNIKFLKLPSTKNNPYYLYQGYKNLGYTYLNLGDSTLAEESIIKLTKYANLLNNDTITASSVMSLGNLYSTFDYDNKVATKYINKAVKLYEKSKNTEGMALSYYNKIIDANRNKEYDTAFVFINKARQYSKLIDPTFDIDLDIFEGEYYFHKKNYTKANEFFLKTIATAIKDSLHLQLEDTYNLYSKSLFGQKKFEEAYKIKEQYQTLLIEDKRQVRRSKGKEATLDFIIDDFRDKAKESENETRLQKAIADNNLAINRILILLIACFIILLISIFYAYSKRKKLIEQLETKNKEYLKAKKETEQLLESKNNFFSTVSHEIRTPLYGIVGISTMLHEDQKLESHKEDISSLKFSADYLLALINDVLQINQIDSKTNEEEKTNFELRLLIKKLSQSFDYISAQNNNKIHAEIDERIPKYINGNSIKLTQILLNLIGNACKFTQNGDIYIKADLVKTDDSSTTIKFQIKDNGIGIPYEKQETIFDEYSQAETINYTYQGTGLGLSIVKKLLKSANSDIHLESEPNKGTIFYFSLSFDVVTNAAENEEKTYDLSKLKNKNILIVEDNQINQKITKRILENNNLTCAAVSNGEEAVVIAKSTSFDLILMDINMTGKDGYKATEEIRQFNSSVPIIALTASDDKTIYSKALQSGMNDVIVKPYDVTQFIQKIYKYIINKNKKAV